MNKKLEEIKLMIDAAYCKMKESIDLEGMLPLSNGVMTEKQEILKNLLEDVRNRIEVILSEHNSRFLALISRVFLVRLLKISESLRMSYAFPGYVESFYIVDTLKSVEKER